jgi:hypothetical protein
MTTTATFPLFHFLLLRESHLNNYPELWHQVPGTSRAGGAHFSFQHLQVALLGYISRLPSHLRFRFALSFDFLLLIERSCLQPKMSPRRSTPEYRTRLSGEPFVWKAVVM